MTFLELPDAEAFDLALELFYSGDAPDLDAAAALAFDMQAVIADCTAEWDQDAGYILMDDGDLLGPDGLRA